MNGALWGSIGFHAGARLTRNTILGGVPSWKLLMRQTSFVNFFRFSGFCKAFGFANMSNNPLPKVQTTYAGPLI